MEKRAGYLVSCAVTVFVGAFLLFQIQPVIGKYITPWFGGSPEVWTTCLLFFQVLLLAGYAYAHISATYLSCRVQVVLHMVLLAAAVATLPIRPQAAGIPDAFGIPVLQVLFVLAVCIGLPYFVLAATSPLVQRWFSRVNPTRSPYRLFAFSNAGSLLALVSYPFVVEPSLSRRVQTGVWSWGLVGFAVVCVCVAIVLARARASAGPSLPSAGRVKSDAFGPGLGTQLLWLALAGGAALELLAVSNKICEDVAAIPFLWVLPLSLYLLSFVICFHSERWYVRPVFISAFILGICGVILVRVAGAKFSAGQQVFVYCAMLFSCCMVCHGELFRLRPGPQYLTRYYLLVSCGGVLGGAFVVVLAPVIFSTYRELYVGLVVCGLFVLLADRGAAVGRGVRRRVLVILAVVCGFLAVFLPGRQDEGDKRAVLNLRNFFGVLTLWETQPQEAALRALILQHGTTFHGLQFINPSRRVLPTAYYGEESGVGLAIRNLRQRKNRRIGAVGLGVGTIATYAQEGDYIRFYEINPQVKELAETRFTYLDDSAADIEMVIGDARLSLEKEQPQQFDLLVLDAFAGGAVPVHLLTTEAFEQYLRHLRSDGVIAAHVSSEHLALEAVVWRLGEHFKMHRVWIESAESFDKGTLAASWVLLTTDREFIELDAIRRAATQPEEYFDKVELWTDDHINVFQLVNSR
jgi:precorrin-6B methylase 2